MTCSARWSTVPDHSKHVITVKVGAEDGEDDKTITVKGGAEDSEDNKAIGGLPSTYSPLLGHSLLTWVPQLSDSDNLISAEGLESYRGDSPLGPGSP